MKQNQETATPALNWPILIKPLFWVLSYAVGFLLITVNTFRSVLNPLWWISKKINPISTHTRFPDRFTAFLFRLDISIQGIFGPYSPFIRKKWILRLKNHFQQNKPADGKVMAVEQFNFRNEDWKEFGEMLLKKPRPLHLPGFLKDDPQYEAFNLQDLISQYGDENVNLSCPVLDGYPGPLKDINIPGVYLHNSEYLFKKYPSLIGKVGFGSLKKLMGKRMIFINICQLFAGRKKTGSPWHCADEYNGFLMLHGEKKWTFIDPEDSPLLLPIGSGWPASFYFTSEATNISKIKENLSEKLLDQDRDRLQEEQKNPLLDQQLSFFRAINRYEVTLSPGDLLLVPPFWWHEVENITPESIGVATRWAYLTPHITNRVFFPWVLYRLPTTAKVIRLEILPTLFNIHNGKNGLTNLLNSEEKAEEIFTVQEQKRQILPSESVAEYYKRYGVERQYLPKDF